MVKKTIAALVFGLFGVVLAAGCEGFGLGGEGGAGGEVPACNDVLIGPPVSLTPGADGSGGDIGAGDSNPGDPEAQTCMDGSELGTYLRCVAQGTKECSARCFAIGAYCVEHAAHPENPANGLIGDLKQCMENLASYTCTYCYSNGDVCTYICAFKGCGFGRCTNTGGKGCE